LVKVFSMGVGVPEIQIFSSASRSKVPAVSTAKWVMLRYGTEWYSTFLPVMPCLSIRIRRRSVNPQSAQQDRLRVHRVCVAEECHVFPLDESERPSWPS
jgi:hypothetical protein